MQVNSLNFNPANLDTKIISMPITNYSSAILNSTSPISTMNNDSPRVNDHYTTSFLVSAIVINIVMAFLAVCLNFLIIFTFVKTASLRETPSNILILGLAIADFTAGVVAQPIFVSYILYILLSSEDHELVPSKQIIWMVFHELSDVILSVSFLNIIAITADRFLAVHLHLRYQEVVTTRRYGIALACMWVISLLSVTTSLFIGFSIGYAALLTLYVALGSTNIFLLGKISRVIRRHSVQIHAQHQSVQQSTIDMPRYKKSVKTIYYIFGVFLLTFISSVTFGILEFFFQDIWEKNGTCLSAGSWTLVMLNTVLNPIIYCLRVGEIRNAMATLLQRSLETNQETEP